jgi:peptidyl-prolyl cis-trans isomerase C
MKKKLQVLIISLLIPTYIYAFDVFKKDESAASVNGKPISKAWLITIENGLKEKNITPNEKLILNQLITNEVLAQEAIKLGLDKNPDFVTNVEINRRRELANTMVAELSKKITITDEKINDAYNQYKKNFVSKEYNIRHILLKNEDDARAVIVELSKGGDFSKIAKVKSNDQKNKDNGGLVGWVRLGNLSPKIAETVQKLQKNTFTTSPIQTAMGWHIIKLEDTRNINPEPLDAIKSNLQDNLKKIELAKLIDEMKLKSNIVRVLQ